MHGADPTIGEMLLDTSNPFPPVAQAYPDGLLCIGGDLSPEMLLIAYRQGIFPWYSEREPIQWWSPHPRCVLFPDEFHCSRRLLRSIRTQAFSFSIDRCFGQVIEACSSMLRPGQRGTWIMPDMIVAYSRLHDLGYAHSFEVWKAGHLCGGLYGISLGAAFFGESMFSRATDASKAAMHMLVSFAVEHHFLCIDCQIPTPHLQTLGAKTIGRKEYLGLLKRALHVPTIRGNWQQ